MSVTIHILPGSSEELTSLGFQVKYDADLDELDRVFWALKDIPGARVEYLESKKFRADIPVKPEPLPKSQ